MTMHRSGVRTAFPLLLAALLVACGSDSPEPAGPEPVASVQVTAPASTLVVGASLQATAVPLSASGSVLQVPIFWSSSAPNTARVSGTGLVEGLAAGPVTISASAGGVSGTLALVVTPPAPEPVATVTVSAPASTVAVGASLQATAVARSASGAVLQVPFNWSSSAPNTARVSGTGVVEGLQAGPVTITAAAGGQSGTLALTVTPPPMQQVGNGLTGHVGVGVNEQGIRASHGYGFSYYTMIHPLQTSGTRDTQLGWGVWVIPENQSFSAPLCPVGTYARDNWPERGPTYRDVYQTLEGGAGLWTTTRFGTRFSKFRINSTPDCYSHQVASTGWQFWGNPLPLSKLGLAQLSNRLLTVPDGVVFTSPDAALLGYGWLALPLVPPGVSPLGVPTGGQSWTLFFHAENFRGPVAFFTPEVWSALNASDPTGVGRGLDARTGMSPSVALEIGITPAFEATDAQGRRWRRIPRLSFSMMGGRAPLIQDVRYYARTAIWDALASWNPGQPLPAQMQAVGYVHALMGSPFVGLTMAGAQVELEAGTFGTIAYPTGAGGQILGMEWGRGFEPGVLPEYYRFDETVWRPTPASQVPPETGLAQQTFAPQQRQAYPALDVRAGGIWDPTTWQAGPFTVTLSDGSVVEYVWYRFVDQPAIARLPLSAAQRARLQAFAEEVHAASTTGGLSVPGPTGGSLVRIDPLQLVTPPPGLERGYVPIVIRQR